MRRPSERVDHHLRQLGVICSAMLMGVVVLGGIVWYLLNSGGFTPPEGMPGFSAILFNLVALVAIVKTLFLPRLFPPPTEGAPEEELLAWHQRTTIVGFALREAAALTALVGVMLTGQQVGGFAMAGLALVAMVLAWPRLEQLQNPRP